MIPFNIDKFRAGAKVITRDGREVKQLTEFDCDDSFSIYGVVDDEVQSWNIAGIYTEYENISEYDLFHPDPEMWVNVYEDKYVSRWHESKEMALATRAETKYIGTFKLVRDEK